MFMTGKGFDLSDLIIKNMMGVFEGSTKAGLPYGCLLTRIFTFYGVNFDGAEQFKVKEFLDKKCFSASRLQMESGGLLIQLEPPPPPSLPQVTESNSAAPDSVCERNA